MRFLLRDVAETLRLDARTGEILYFRAVDWLMWASIGAAGLVAGIIFAFWWRRRRKIQAQTSG